MASNTSRGVNNTAFSPNPDITAQLTGTGQPVPGNVTATYVPSGNTDITSILRFSRFVAMTTATGNSTVLTSYVPNAGGLLTVQVTNDASGARTITFGTGFRATGTLVGTNSKILLVSFASDGTTWNETGRSVGAIT